MTRQAKAQRRKEKLERRASKTSRNAAIRTALRLQGELMHKRCMMRPIAQEAAQRLVSNLRPFVPPAPREERATFLDVFPPDVAVFVQEVLANHPPREGTAIDLFEHGRIIEWTETTGERRRMDVLEAMFAEENAEIDAENRATIARINAEMAEEKRAS